MRPIFRAFLIVACLATATAAMLATTGPAEGVVFASAPLLAALALLLQSRRSGTRRPKATQELAVRIGDLSEQLQRERIESGNRIAALEARMSVLESESLQISEIQSQHLAHLARLAGPLAVHSAEVESVFASLGATPTG